MNHKNRQGRQREAQGSKRHKAPSPMTEVAGALAHVAAAASVQGGGQGMGMIAMLLKASGASLEALRARVSKVRWSDAGVAISAGVECIDFDFDGKAFRGEMRGRMKDVLVGWGDENDRKVAVALLLDGHASELHVGATA